MKDRQAMEQNGENVAGLRTKIAETIDNLWRHENLFESEIQRIDKAEKELADAKESLDIARKRKLKELKKFDCPVCGGELYIGTLPYGLKTIINETRDCPKCQRRIALKVMRVAMTDEYLDATYGERTASMVGFTFEDKKSSDLTNEELQNALDYYLGLKGRTRKQEDNVVDWLKQKEKMETFSKERVLRER